MFQTTILKNGIKVITKNLREAQTIYVEVYVAAGSKYCHLKKEGLAHFLEHVVMNGSKKYPDTLLVKRKIEEIGGSISAVTGKERVGYWIKVARGDLEKGLDVLLSLVSDPLLEDGELGGEKKIVLEEIAKAEDNVEKRVSKAFFSLAFGGHPLGVPGLGYPESLMGIGYEDVSGFYRDYYVAPNITVCASGRLDHDELVKLAETGLQNLGETSPPAYVPFVSGKTGPKVVVLEERGQQARALLGFLYQPRTFRDYILNLFIAHLLWSKDRLYARVREKEKLAYDIRPYVNRFQDSSFLAVYGGFNYEKVGRALNSILEELASLKHNSVGSQELDKIKKLMEVGLLFELEVPKGWVDFALDWYNLVGKVVEPEEFVEEVYKVKAEDVLNLAKEIFVPERAYLSVTHGEMKPSDFEKIISEKLGS